MLLKSPLKVLTPSISKEAARAMNGLLPKIRFGDGFVVAVGDLVGLKVV